MSRRELLGCAGLALAGGVAVSLGARRARADTPLPRSISMANMVDLTHTLSGDFPVIPIPNLTFSFRQTPIATLEKNGVYANRWEMIEHNGTHIDAPGHFVANMLALDALPLPSLLAPAAVIDITARAAREADTAVTIDDVVAWEKKHGELPAGAAVLVNSGWGEKAGDPRAFVGQDEAGVRHHPGFSTDAAEFLVRERNIAGVGIDTLSLDIGPAADFPAHKALFRQNKWGLECVANLSKIPPAGATVFVGAMKVKDASGGPTRVIAMW